jgi:hypothetical protein
VALICITVQDCPQLIHANLTQKNETDLSPLLERAEIFKWQKDVQSGVQMNKQRGSCCLSPPYFAAKESV